MALKPNAERKRRWTDLQADPELLETITIHVASGGSVVSLAEVWDIPYGWVMGWLHEDKARNDAYLAALEDRSEWAVESVLAELRALAHSDIRKMYDDQGRLLPPDQWPDDLAKAVASIETEEVFEGVGERRVEVGQLRKLKRFDKLKALELLGKNLSMFVDKVNVSGSLSLADLVAESWKKPEDEKK